MPVSPKTRLILWTRAAGRCQYQGCNSPLLGDLISGKEDLNSAFVAHIVAEDPNGPRGDAIRSKLLADKIENVMLMCHPHHRLIDHEGLAEHPESRLLAMKQAHESRIAEVTAIQRDRDTWVLLYAARIGEHESPVRIDLAKQAVMPERYSADAQGISISLAGTALGDHEDRYWDFQTENLRRQFRQKVKERVADGSIRHLSVFALAPQPLLVELGRQLCDIVPADVYQLHREPKTWAWLSDTSELVYETAEAEPDRDCRIVALKLSLSATITADRVLAAVGRSVPIWSIDARAPHNDCMRRREHLANFRALLRRTFDRIKARHGESAEIHIFPALPVSAAIEIGRVWMPKADLPLVIYDQHRGGGGFRPRLRIDAQQADSSNI